MRVVFLYGPPGVGKLTVARPLERQTGIGVFHNHLVVDLLTAVFKFGSKPFRSLREDIWLGAFRETARSGTDLIFTFAPESTVSPTFVPGAAEAVESLGGRVIFVSLSCSEEVLRERMGAPERSEWGKLDSWTAYQEWLRSGALDFEIPCEPDLSIDTGAATPDDAALQITNFMGDL